MLTWITANIGTLVVLAVLVAIVGAIIRRLYRNRKNGGCSCGGGCAGCSGCAASSTSCHPQQK